MTREAERRMERARIEFPRRLKSIRKGQKLSMWELSQMTGVSKSSLGQYESQGVMPTLENAIRLSAFFGVSIEWLMGGDW